MGEILILRALARKLRGINECRKLVLYPTHWASRLAGN